LWEGEARYEQVYRDVWNSLFTPVPAIATSIKSVMDDNGLVPNKYAAAHLRVMYTKENRKEEVLKKWTRGGIKCASTLRPGRPIFVASDSKVVTEYSPIYGRERNGVIVIHENNPNPPLHLDRADVNLSKAFPPPASNFYDTLTDLYLLALSGCLFFSKGGYGLWAVLIGGNLICVGGFIGSNVG
jgi:hypothetical protein